METKRRGPLMLLLTSRRFRAWAAALTVLAAPTGYVGLYLLTVGRVGFVMNCSADCEVRYLPTFELAGSDRQFLRSVFAPVHAVDRRMRPGYWVEHVPNPALL